MLKCLIKRLPFSITKRRASMAATKSGEAIAKLRDFGYGFNKAGELRKIDETTGEPGDEPFVFEISKDHAKNQSHYEKLADQIPEIVYDLLEQQGLYRNYIPEDEPPEHSTFVFTQPAKLQKSKKLLVLIHGSGYVRAGQWARSLIINNSLDHGTQLPYIKKAQELGYDILVTNTNDNYREIDGIRKPIKGLNSAMAHAEYVWKHIVMPSDPQSVAIVAHSYGGPITLELARKFPEFFQKKVFAIAFTDSAHGSSSAEKFLTKVAKNWVSSNEPLDKEIPTSANSIPCVSAGHPKHEWSSYAAFKSVFEFMEHKYEEFDGVSSTKKAKIET